MGGDYAPKNTVAGSLEALRERNGGISVVLVGREERIAEEIGAARRSGFPERAIADSCTIVDAREVIDMQDSPNAALKTKKDSSITVGLSMHQEGKVNAFVSAGNTGAVLSASTLILGRIPGVSRPTIGALFPTEGTPCFVLDAGANVDCRPRHLFEFAVMGAVYVSSLVGRREPRVGLLSIGEEDSKGNETTLEALSLLRNSRLNFVGNIEGRDILKGKVDVAVCDGFVGNILLKFGESIPGFLKTSLTAFAEGNVWHKLRILAARGGLRAVMKKLDYQEYGGVPLLGVRGVSIIGHGGSTPKAIKNMILRAEEMVRWELGSRIEQAILTYG
jgi:glycerol-3-phosphate acyltransferase PlsX